MKKSRRRQNYIFYQRFCIPESKLLSHLQLDTLYIQKHINNIYLLRKILLKKFPFHYILA